jgi:adenine-specific DNA methylase
MRKTEGPMINNAAAGEGQQKGAGDKQTDSAAPDASITTPIIPSTGTPKKCLLERGVPVAMLNEDARKEKLAIPPVTRMHYYQTRKPLITARLAVAGTLLSAEDVSKDADIYNRIFGLKNMKERGYTMVPSELIKKIRERYPDGITVLDPFTGTGMILFEALRLGCNVVGVDYNPVACLIARATLEYPLKYNEIDQDRKFVLYKDVKKYAEEIFATLRDDLQQFYPAHNGKEVKAYIYAWAVRCPHCGRETPLVGDWRLDSKKGVYLAYETDPEKGEVKYSIKRGKAPEGNVSRGNAICLFCTQRISNEHIVADVSENEREHMLAVYLGGGEFAVADERQKEAPSRAREHLMSNIRELSRYIPTEAMGLDIRSHKYLQNWHRLYNPRQLLVLASLAREVRRKVEDLMGDTEYAAAVGTYLSLLIAKHADRNSRGTRWDNSRLIIANTLSMRGISMMWNHAETNPFIKGSGSLVSMMSDVLKGLEFALSALNPRPTLVSPDGTNNYGGNNNSNNGGRNTKPIRPTAEVINASILSWDPKRKFKFIITDPPYYDDVPYPEIMQFFQVWHARTVGDLLGFNAVPETSEELSVGRTRDEKTFESRMLAAIQKLHDLLEDDGIATIFYAHKRVEGWKYLLEALRRCGFNVTSTIALWTESSENVIARGKSSIYHSLLTGVQTCALPISGTMVEVEEEIRQMVLERYPELERIYGRDRVNLMVAASGIVLEVVTSYSEITSFTKDLPEYALEAGQRFLMEAFARRVLELERVDPQTMLYIWLRHEGEDWIDYTTFNQTIKAMGVSEQAVAALIENKGKKIRLLDFKERAPLEVDGTDPFRAETLIDAVHLALREYIRKGPSFAVEYASRSPFGTKAIHSVVRALGEISSTRPEYEEGKICKKLAEDWRHVHRTLPRT